MKFRRSLASPAFLIALTLAAANGIAATAQAPRPDYTRESSLFEHLDRVYRYAPDGTGSKEITGVIAVNDQAGVKSLSVISFPFASNAEHVEIDYVRVRRPDGTLLPTPASDAQELPDPVTREAPFYSDLKQEQIPIRSLREGDHLEYKLRIVRTKPETPNQFWGTESFFTVSSGVVVLSETLELHLPKSSNAQVWSPNDKPALSETPTERVYRWETSQPIPTAGKKHNDLLRLEKDPHFADETGPRLPPIAWTSFHSWQEVGAWYRSMEASRADPDDDIRARVKELTAGKSTPEEKTRAIYAYVSSQVRYIGVAFGIGRYQPHAAGEVLSNQYGDCKDKTTLLIAMLAAANIPADAVLIGAGVAFNEAVPSPASFNHAINLAHVDNQPVWLDATAEVAPYRLLNPEIRGHKALVIPLTGEARIETTPRDPPFPSLERFTANATLDDKGTTRSTIVLEDRGDAEVIFRTIVRSVSPAQWDELMQRISESMGYSGKVTNAQFSRPDATLDPFRISYDYEREKSGDWDTHRILPQLAPIGLNDVDDQDPPASPIQLGYPMSQVCHAAIKLPPNWSAELPAAIHLKSSFATFDKTYAFKDGILTTDRRFEVLEKEIPAKDWPEYHKWYKDAGLEGETYIQLVPASGFAPTERITIETPSNPAAAALVAEAMQAARSSDAATAQTKLDQAKALNPTERGLYGGYASLDFLKHDMNAALKDLHREISNHPDNPPAYRALAQMEMQQKKPEDAIKTLQSEVDRNPADADAVLYLSSIQIDRSEFAAAEKVLRAGLLASPTNVAIKLSLGTVLLHLHKPDEGAPLLRDIINTSDDPSQLNGAAYELADASIDFPLAEKASRHSLDLLDTLSTNGETGPAALYRAQTIIASWDTLGWILYRENKLADAETWIRAAWRNGTDAETGYHLAIILQDQKHPNEALAQLQLALAGQPGPTHDEVNKLIHARIDELRKAGASAATKNASMELQNQRTYQFPRGAFKSTGESYATIELDVTTHGITGIRFVQGDQSLESLFGALRAVKLDLQLPPESHASLLRRAIVSCHTQATCQLVLLPPADALQQH